MDMNQTIVINHNFGFFSCCSVRLAEIILYVNKYNKLPVDVNSSNSFRMYKCADIDVTFHFFTHYNEIHPQIEPEYKHIDIDHNCYQFTNYKNIDYTYIIPFITKYFTPTPSILSNYNNLINKYNIIPQKCIGLYYRGTDKAGETEIDSFESYYNKLKEIELIDPGLQVIIQTDTIQFLEYMKEQHKNKHKNIIVIEENNLFYTNKGIHYEQNSRVNYLNMYHLFSTFLILSKCKYILCSTSNCSLWITFYRNNANNVYQNLNKKWI